ncbi:DUF3541 domain-containing protein [Vibrio sp. ZSDZ34]|uniref:DUF3541 domain-containing protein n=2 Tax=Vibrio gelatinilyticus TaxID=2893468 RepID=A0A9X1W800_9VIBR|nr:DUF3541 domain-containing protein [Vibrio gelatinilyticus]MCJ2376112.1 DUF3541 domain-containing protein [Vibrio gelatinilyticus]
MDYFLNNHQGIDMRVRKGMIGIAASILLITGAGVVELTRSKSTPQNYVAAETVKETYESRLYTLSPYKTGHFGLRMFRQTQDPKYHFAIWTDMAYIASQLNHLSSLIDDEKAILAYSMKRLDGYSKARDERSRRRHAATKHDPKYFFMGLDLLRYVARLNEYGLKHKKDAALREVLNTYDFKTVLTDKTMIKAWAAQLANQAYWLKQIGEEDLVSEFTQAFQEAYPEREDYRLSTQQFSNKLYGMTHIILADSGYYQKTIKESDHQWIYDYFRTHIDDIVKYTKEDVIAEVGLTFLLAGLEDDPVVKRSQEVIRNAIDRKYGMIPSVSGDFDFAYGEHRNVLAIMLLDWKQPNQGPNVAKTPALYRRLPFGLETQAPTQS